LNAPLTLFWNISRFHPWLYLVAWRGFTPETLKVGSRLPVGGSLTGLTVSRRDIVTTYDLAHNDQLEPRVKQALLAQGLTGCISVPFLFQEQTIGASNLIFQETHRLTHSNVKRC